MRPLRSWRSGAGIVAAALLLAACSARPAAAQVRWRELVLTMGGSVEGYSGNFAGVTTTVADSADDVIAAVAEVGARGTLWLFQTRPRSFDVSFDAGLRQTAAFGYERFDYAPREWVGSAAARYTQALGAWGSLEVRAGARGRSVQDRPLSAPLFLQPGYTTLQGSAGVLTRSFDDLSFDARVDLERTDYGAAILPQLRLLDRTSSGFEAGARWGGAHTMRFYGGYRWTDYRNQKSFVADDPFRRDRTAQVGVELFYEGTVLAQVGLDGTVNRSNSRRPEYDALSARAQLTAPLPHDFSLNAFALLTTKRYVHETGFAVLVPGEEADNASIAYLQIGRPIAVNLDAAFRLGWTRAETDIGGAYYRRVGASVQLNYRPTGF